jgi:hypothetical protein
MKFLFRAAAVAVLSSAMGACATAPENVQPSYVSDIPYQGWTCSQLQDEQDHVTAALASASRKQRVTRSQDAVGVLILGLPTSSLAGGNLAPEIAHYKGELAAVKKAMTFKACPDAPAPAKP